MKHFFRLVLLLLLGGALLYVLSARMGAVPPLGSLLDPVDGLYRTARAATYPGAQTLALAGLEHPVTVERDERGVPHIFAESDHDAVMALGYVTAQDRLFQLDFIPRAASGRLAEAFGPGAVETDRFLRRTGMDWGARRNLALLRRDADVSLDLVGWYVDGVNAYLDGLDAADLPFEFRLLGYRPDRYTPLQALRLLQYMTFDLTYRTDDAAYERLKTGMRAEDYARLYPQFSSLFVPIVHDEDVATGVDPGGSVAGRMPWNRHLDLLERERRTRAALFGTPAEGFIEGKGSNNWAVNGVRSATGAPLLAGDMHLLLTLPAIWYEVHLVTPEMNTYGVTIPGAPLPVEAFNDHLGWTFTNTGADQIDHYALELDAAGTQYRYQGGFRPLEAVLDTIYVNGGAPVIDTLYYAHWGPVIKSGADAVALQWVAHKPSRTLHALWEMNHARDYASFEAALRFWDTPMQNILYGGRDGTIAIRSTGNLPLRRGGHYLGHDWRAAYRSLRIDALLRGKPTHTVDDMKRYQADVHAVQRDLFVPLLDTLTHLSPRADTLRHLLARWDGETSVDRPEPLVLDEFLTALRELAWDEPVFDGAILPVETRLYRLLTEAPGDAWLDVRATPEREDAPALLRMALDTTVMRLSGRYGWGVMHWRWGDHHRILFRHLTRSEALRPLWRGPMPYPGFAATLSPAGARTTTHSASWRMIVDFSQDPPRGYGVFPGGAQGNPFGAHYDDQIDAYVGFRYFPLRRPARPGELEGVRRLNFRPR